MWENKVKTHDVFELRVKNTCYYDIKVLSKVKIKLQKIEKSINKVIVIIDKVEYNIWNSYGLGIAEGSLFDSTKSVQSYWNTPIKNVQNFMTGKDIKNMLERVNKELKRRGRVIGSFSS